MGPEHWETNWRPDREWGCGAYLLIGAWLLFCLGLALPNTARNMQFAVGAKAPQTAVITDNRNPHTRGAAVQALTVQLADGQQVELETTAPGYGVTPRFTVGEQTWVVCLEASPERCRLPGLHHTLSPLLSWGPLILTMTLWWTSRQPNLRAWLNRAASSGAAVEKV